MVTWNRRDLLTRSLDAVLSQAGAPAQVVVVDNASTDGSAELVADRYPDVDLVRLRANTGGAGGFALGIARALDLGADAVWIMDDDTIPQPGALGALVDARATLQAADTHGQPPVVVASRVEWVDGRAHPMNTPRPKPFATREELRLAAAADCVPVRTASFVSLLLDAERIREVGLPVADFFLWNDDFEYTARLIRGRTGVLCPASVVRHETKKFGGTDVDPGPRFYNEVRNKVWTFTRSDALSPGERAMYAASTARRWARTFASSSDRATLRAGLVNGVRDGFRAGPRPTPEVLAQADPSVTPQALRRPVAEPLTPGQPFSVLLPVYARDDAGAFLRSFRSVTVEQTRRPDDVVIMVDGPVGPELDAALEQVATFEQVPTLVHRLPVNGGLGPALDTGLTLCRHEIVARQDADDVSFAERFARQLPLIEQGADVVGSALVEFESSPDHLGDLRIPPLSRTEIELSARWKQPVNHPTVVYRRSAVQAVGGYGDLRLLEDYWLFARMIHAGAVFANLAEPLVAYRVGKGAYARRGGQAILGSELDLQRRLRALGFTTNTQFVRNSATRGVYRLVPESVRRKAYRTFVMGRDGMLGRQR